MAKLVPGGNFHIAEAKGVGQQAAFVNAVASQYQGLRGRDGMYMELFFDDGGVDYSAETSSISLADINGKMREAPFDGFIANWFQRDRNDDIYPVSGGICHAAYKPYYGEVIESWKMRTTGSVTNSIWDIEWDSARRVWWVVDSQDTGNIGTIIQLSEDFSKSLGWWKIDNSANLSGLTVYGNYLYVADQMYTYGRITKHEISSDGSSLGGMATGSSISDSVSVNATTSHVNTFGITNDGTNLYVVAYSSDKVSTIAISDFASGFVTDYDSSPWSSATGTFRGIACDGSYLYLSDISGTGRRILKIEKDFSKAYNSFATTNSGQINGLTWKDGDLYSTNINKGVYEKIAIKNTRLLMGQITDIDLADYTHTGITYVEDLFGAGVHGHIAVSSTMVVYVYDDSWNEVTSGTPQTTTLNDTTGNSLTVINDVANNGTSIFMVIDGATESIAEFPISSLTGGSVNLTASHVKASDGSNPQYRTIAYNSVDDYIITVDKTTANYAIHGFDRGNSWAKTIMFEAPTIFKDAGTDNAMYVEFDDTGRHLYMLFYSGYNAPGLIIDWYMSKYMGDNGQPYVVGTFTSEKTVGRSLSFDGGGNLLTPQANTPKIQTLAVANAEDNAVTGKAARHFRIYNNSGKKSATANRSYPGVTGSFDARRTIRYRRKYDPSVYSSQHNVLPLDGLYVATNSGGVTIIDLESNTEFMTFNRPETASNRNLVDASGSIVVEFRDLLVIDDKMFIATSDHFQVVDFINDTGYSVQSSSGMRKYVNSIADRNLCSSTLADVWSSSYVNTRVTMNSSNIESLSGKQDTSIRPEDHNGSETSLDSSEIYIVYGTVANGGGLIKWQTGASFSHATTGRYAYRLADDWKIVYAQMYNASGTVVVIGDARKVYNDHATTSWVTQTGYGAFAWDTELSNRYISDFKVKTIWEESGPRNYIAVSVGQQGASDNAGINIIDVSADRIEFVRQQSTSSSSSEMTWDKYGRLWAAWLSAAGGYPNLNVYKRSDYVTALNSNYFWENIFYTNETQPIWVLQDDVRGLTWSHNTLCVSTDDGAQIFEFPPRDSQIEGKSVSSVPATPVNCFVKANQYAKPASSENGYWRERRIFSDVNDTSKYTFTDGGTYSWSAVGSLGTVFGGNSRAVNRAGGSETPQSKVSWITETDCVALIIYTYRDSSQGKFTITVTDTAGDVVKTYDAYSSEPVAQDQIVIKGLTKEAHTVTMETINDKHASSSAYNMILQGHVEIVETATAKVDGTITHEVTFDGGTTWEDISSSDEFNLHTITGTPDGTIKTRIKFEVNDSEEVYVNDKAVIYSD